MGSHNHRKLFAQISSSRLFFDEVYKVMRHYNYRANQDSPISADSVSRHYYESIWSGELHEQSDVQSQMSLLASIQDMSLAIEDVGSRPAAFMVLLRGALEAGAWAKYLASPDIPSITERARRGLNEMLYGGHQQWLSLCQRGDNVSAAEKLDVLNKWLDVASAYPQLGQIKRINQAKKFNPPYVGEERPKISSVIGELFETDDNNKFGKFLYSVVSAPAHSAAHGFAIAGAQKLLPDGSQVIEHEAELAPGNVAMWSLTGFSAIYTGMRAVFIRYGWPHDSCEKKLENAYSDWTEIINSPS